MQLFDMDNYPKLKYYRQIIVTPEFIVKFESKVVRDDCMPDGCHIWTGYRNFRNYGLIRNNKKDVKAHRASYVIYKGDITHGLVICTSCDNPPCVNPAHLFLGTQAVNMRVAVIKGRNAALNNTHCPQGHEYLGDNLYIRPNRNERNCRMCRNEHMRKRRLAS